MPEATTNHIKTILEAEMGNYESVMNRAKSVTDKFTSGGESKVSGFASRMKGAFKNIGGSVSDFKNKHGEAVSKIGTGMAVMSTAVIAGTGVAAKAFAGFAADALKSAADTQALNSQYKQVFTGMEKQANSSINAIAKDTNILPQRLKPAFTQMAAFAKTAGFDTKDALDLSSRATKAAADSAAYYDRSLGDVTESLQSYLKGNYENDAALGLSSTETTRNAAANKAYGKSFNDLSEAQKQLTLLQMVEDANKLSGALGQASREGNGWENVMGNIQAGIEGFKSAVAGPFLTPLMNALGKLTPLFGVVQEKIEKFFQSAKGQAIVKQFSDTVSVLADQLVKFVSNIDIGAIADQIGKFVNSFTNGDLPGTISNIVEKIGSFLAMAMKIIPVLIQWAPTILAVVAGFKALSVISSIVSIVSALIPVFTAVGGAITTVVGILGGPVTLAIAAVVAAGIALYKNWDTVVAYAKKLGDWISKTWSNIVEATVEMASNVATWFGQMKDKAVAKVTDLVNSVSKWWSNLKSNVSKFISNMVTAAVNGFNNMKTAAIQRANALVTGVINFFRNMWNNIKNTVSNIASSVSSGFNRVKSIATSLISHTVSQVVNTFRQVVSGISSTVGRIGSTIGSGLQRAANVVANWARTFYNAGANLVGMIAGGISSAVHKVTDAIGSVVGKVRDFLPFSPAKTGPLSDLDKLNFGGTISTGIYNGERQVTQAMNDILNVPKLVEPALSFGSASGANYRYASDVDNRLQIDLHSTVEIDKRAIAETTHQDMTKEQARAATSKNRALGYR